MLLTRGARGMAAALAGALRARGAPGARGLADAVQAVGRRKDCVAQVTVRPGTGRVRVNGQEAGEYFPGLAARAGLLRPLVETGTLGKFDVDSRVRGGGTGAAGRRGAPRDRACPQRDEHRNVPPRAESVGAADAGPTRGRAKEAREAEGTQVVPVGQAVTLSGRLAGGARGRRRNKHVAGLPPAGGVLV